LVNLTASRTILSVARLRIVRIDGPADTVADGETYLTVDRKKTCVSRALPGKGLAPSGLLDCPAPDGRYTFADRSPKREIAVTWFWAVLAASSALAALTFVSLLSKTKHCCDQLLRQHWEAWQREQRFQAQASTRGRVRAAEPPIAPERPAAASPSVAEPVAVAD
jgi:hypothetical protein